MIVKQIPSLEKRDFSGCPGNPLPRFTPGTPVPDPEHTGGARGLSGHGDSENRAPSGTPAPGADRPHGPDRPEGPVLQRYALPL